MIELKAVRANDIVCLWHACHFYNRNGAAAVSSYCWLILETGNYKIYKYSWVSAKNHLQTEIIRDVYAVVCLLKATYKDHFTQKPLYLLPMLQFLWISICLWTKTTFDGLYSLVWLFMTSLTQEKPDTCKYVLQYVEQLDVQCMSWVFWLLCMFGCSSQPELFVPNVLVDYNACLDAVTSPGCLFPM